MLLDDVSGRKKKRTIKAAPDTHSISQIVHRQPLATTAKDEARGPCI